MSNASATATFRERVDAVEEAYEFFLSYAAKGVDPRHGTVDDSQVRFMVSRMAQAIDGLPDAARADGTSPVLDAWLDVVADDGRKTRAALALVAARPVISSKIIDNLNASIHVRALLTDLFILDEAVD